MYLSVPLVYTLGILYLSVPFVYTWYCISVYHLFIHLVLYPRVPLVYTLGIVSEGTISLYTWYCISVYHLFIHLVLYPRVPLVYTLGIVSQYTISLCTWYCISGYHLFIHLVLYPRVPLVYTLGIVFTRESLHGIVNRCQQTNWLYISFYLDIICVECIGCVTRDQKVPGSNPVWVAVVWTCKGLVVCKTVYGCVHLKDPLEFIERELDSLPAYVGFLIFLLILLNVLRPLRAHSWLNWVDEDDDEHDEVGLKEKPEDTRYIKKITSK